MDRNRREGISSAPANVINAGCGGPDRRGTCLPVPVPVPRLRLAAESAGPPSESDAEPISTTSSPFGGAVGPRVLREEGAEAER